MLAIAYLDFKRLRDFLILFPFKIDCKEEWIAWKIQFNLCR